MLLNYESEKINNCIVQAVEAASGFLVDIKYNLLQYRRKARRWVPQQNKQCLENLA